MQSAVLDYEPVKRRAKIPWRRILKWPLRILLTASIGVALVLVVRVGRYVALTIQRDRVYQKCLAYDEPRDTVVFAWRNGGLPDVPFHGSLREVPRPPETRRSWNSPWPVPTWIVRPRAGREAWLSDFEVIRTEYPDCWRELWSLPEPRIGWEQPNKRVRCASGLSQRPLLAFDASNGGSNSDRGWAFVYVHGRTSSAGQARLVEVLFDGPGLAFGGQNMFFVQVGPAEIKPASGSTVKVKRVSCEGLAEIARSPLVMYAGQSDPLDASRFTIPLDSGGVTYTIEGILNNDDTVRLRLLEAPRR